MVPRRFFSLTLSSFLATSTTFFPKLSRAVPSPPPCAFFCFPVTQVFLSVSPRCSPLCSYFSSGRPFFITTSFVASVLFFFRSRRVCVPFPLPQACFFLFQASPSSWISQEWHVDISFSLVYSTPLSAPFRKFPFRISSLKPPLFLPSTFPYLEV